MEFLGTSVVQVSYCKIKPCIQNHKNGLNTGLLAGLAGFEPAEMPESKSGALPLGDSPILRNHPFPEKVTLYEKKAYAFFSLNGVDSGIRIHDLQSHNLAR